MSRYDGPDGVFEDLTNDDDFEEEFEEDRFPGETYDDEEDEWDDEEWDDDDDWWDDDE